MRTLTVNYFVVTAKGDGLKHTAKKVTLPRQHALAFAQFCYEGGTPEGLFSLDEKFLKRLPPYERDLVENKGEIEPPSAPEWPGAPPIKFPKRKKASSG